MKINMLQMAGVAAVAATLSGCAIQAGGTKISFFDLPPAPVYAVPVESAPGTVYYYAPPAHGVVTYYYGPGVYYYHDRGQRRYYRHH